MKVVVLHKGGLAHYEVALYGNAGYQADLQKYSGEQEYRPPQMIHFQKEGRHCTGDCAEQDLMDDLLDAVAIKH